MGMGGVSNHQPEIYSSPHLGKSLHLIFIPPRQKSIPLPTTKQQFSSYNPIKTAFLAVVIAPVQFCFNSILFGHLGHVTFDFN